MNATPTQSHPPLPGFISHCLEFFFHYYLNRTVSPRLSIPPGLGPVPCIVLVATPHWGYLPF